MAGIIKKQILKHLSRSVQGAAGRPSWEGGKKEGKGGRAAGVSLRGLFSPLRVGRLARAGECGRAALEHPFPLAMRR